MLRTFINLLLKIHDWNMYSTNNISGLTCSIMTLRRTRKRVMSPDHRRHVNEQGQLLVNSAVLCPISDLLSEGFICLA